MLRKSDLSLVKVFLAIYDNGSLSRAAEELNITQPSVSYSLARLRDLLNDPLFTRTRDGMIPTFTADQFYQVFHESICKIEQAIADARQFEPKTSTRTFRIALSDLGEFYLLPKLLRDIHIKAPNCKVEVVTTEIEKVEGWLSQGRVDLAVGNLSFLKGRTLHKKLFDEHYQCILSTKHTRIRGEPTLDDFLNEHHIFISKASGHFYINDYLGERGKQINIALHIPHFSALPGIIPDSDLIACLPSRVAKEFTSPGNLVSFPLPFPTPEFEVSLYWTESTDDPSALRWLCEVAYHALKDI